MNEASSSNTKLKYYKKKPFRMKKNKNGVLLKIHHTVQNDNGEVRRIRFLQGCFSESNEFIVVVDNRGNIFIFNLVSSQFWVLENHIIRCSSVKFIPTRNDRTILGTKDGNLLVVDIDIGQNIIQLMPHSTTIVDFSFATAPANVFLSITKIEAKLFDVETFDVLHTLDYSENNLSAVNVCFIPKTDKIFSCFTDDTIHIWNHQQNMKLIKQFHPFQIIEKYLKKTTAEILDFFIDNESTSDSNWFLINKIEAHHIVGRIKMISLTENGKFLCISSIDNLLIIMMIGTWEIYKVFNLKNIRIKQLQFLPQQTDIDFKYLTILSTNGDLFLFNIDNINMKIIIETNQFTNKIFLSKNGLMFGEILKTGEIIIKNIGYYTNRMETYQRSLNDVKENKESHEILLERVFNEIKNTLPKARLISILKEYNEYPSRYRQIIWRSLLQLPQNNDAFTELLKKGYHPCVLNYDKDYPLRDLTVARNLKKIVSSLAYWCRIFGQETFLSTFIFPFLKVYQNDLLSCFEIIATILINQCQLWFEFSPLPPINYLGMIENILTHFEPQLINFFIRKNITSKTYAWKIMENNFTEILDERQWYQLWDNIISNDAYFLLFSIVAYNILQKTVIMNLEFVEKIEEFYQEQNNIDVKKLIHKTYELMNNCPEELHPKRYMKTFQSLNKMQYQKFENYPKILIESKNNEMEKLQVEQELLETKMRQLEKIEKSLGENLKDDLKDKEQENRMKEVEKLYEEALLKEEERIASQRKLLILYQRQIRERELQILDESRKCIIKKQISTKESELDTLLKTLERNRLREETDIIMAEENFKSRETRLLCEKLKINMNFMTDNDNETLQHKYKYTIKQLEGERVKLLNELKMVKEQSEMFCHDDDDRDSESDLINKIDVIENLLRSIQIEFTKVMADKYSPTNNNVNVEKVKELTMDTNILEEEVRKLLRKKTK